VIFQRQVQAPPVTHFPCDGPLGAIPFARPDRGANGPREGLSPLQRCVQHNLTSCPRFADAGHTAGLCPAKEGLLVAKRNADAVRWLIDRGVDVNAKRVLWDCNHTALHVTTELEGGAIELTRMLLDAGADPNIRDDKYHATVLGWAEYCGQPQIADLLRQRGATT